MRPFFAEFVHFTLVSDDALLHEEVCQLLVKTR